MKIEVLVAEDHKFSRQGLVFGLKRYDNINVVAEAENGQQAYDLAKQYNPDLILMDIVMPLLSGIDATKKIKEHNPKIKILILTSHKEKEKVLKAFNSGADAYCMKNIKLDDLVNIIETVVQGSVWVDPAVASYILEILQRKNTIDKELLKDKNRNSTYKNLTNREKEILKLIAKGLSNKDISEKLCVSLYTVKNHVSNIIQKLAVDDRTQAALIAIKEDLI